MNERKVTHMVNLDKLREYIEGFNTIICYDRDSFLKAAKLCEEAGIPLGYDPEVYVNGDHWPKTMSLGQRDNEHLHFAGDDYLYYPGNRVVNLSDLESEFCDDDTDYDESDQPDLLSFFGCGV